MLRRHGADPAISFAMQGPYFKAARAALKQEFGTKVVLHGAMDNQQTLAFGSVADVEQEVRENLDILGRGGRYILAPCHNIQAVSPPENIVAMYATAYAEGWY